MKNNFIKAFTLVELIVVITILAVLATVAFISFQGYTSSSRDSVRLADLKNISKSFEINRTKDINFPLPDKKVDISSSGTIFQYQGELSQNILESDLNIFDGGLDPVTKKPYWYAVNLARNKFQIIWFLENNQNVANILANTTFADNSDKYIKSSGDELWILLNETTNEVIVQSGSFNEIDIENNIENYSVFIKGWPKFVSSENLSSKLSFRIRDNSSCYSILKSGNSTGNGVYVINPTGEREFEVYCDMSAWWLVYFESSFNYSYTSHQECINEKLFSDSQKQNIQDLLSVSHKVIVESDIYTSFSADDSINNSTIYTSKSDSGKVFDIFMWNGRDNTTVTFVSNKTQFKCTSWFASNSCWYLNKPSINENTPDVIIFEFDYQPKCNWSTALRDEWNRNQFTLRWTYYNVIIQ